MKNSAIIIPEMTVALNRKNKKRRSRHRDTSSQGRWTDEEHQKFVEGKQLHRFQMKIQKQLSDLLLKIRISFLFSFTFLFVDS